MRKLLAYAFGLFLLLGGCREGLKSDAGKADKPNILFIAVDDLRPELNFYGVSHIHSPSLDKLAESSTVFHRAYCNVPVCGASRASLLTGTRPTRFRFIDARTQKDVDYPEAVSLPMLLKQQGYTTLSNGKVYHHGMDDSLAWNEIWHSGANRFALEANREIGRNSYRGVPLEAADVPDTAYSDGQLALKTIQDLRRLKKSKKPFFLAVGFHKPHLPFCAPQKYWDMYDPSRISLPENYLQPSSTPDRAFHNYGELRNYEGMPKKGPLSKEQATELIHGYYACVSYIDAMVGSVLDELKRLELDKNTIVVLWGDHGWNLGDHMLWCKHCTFESSLHVPLMIKIPGIEGGKTGAITEYVDIYPSLCELVGIEQPKHLEGESFVPLLHGQERSKDYAICKFKDAITLIKGDYFYTEWINDQGVASNRMLFNHANDPLELNNLAEQAAYKHTVDKMSADLRTKWGEDFLKNTTNKP